MAQRIEKVVNFQVFLYSNHAETEQRVELFLFLSNNACMSISDASKKAPDKTGVLCLFSLDYKESADIGAIKVAQHNSLTLDGSNTGR